MNAMKASWDYSGRGTIAYLEADFLRNAKPIAFLNEEDERPLTPILHAIASPADA